MATCNDCLYFKRCVVLGVELNIERNKEADKNCRHFKNKSDFVEVVRCKDCKMWGTQNHSTNACNLHTMVTRDVDFCSYGVCADKEMKERF